MQSKATSVAAYLASLPADRRAAVEAVRAVIRKNLDPDIEEGMQYGMIGYFVPHRVYPAGYHCDPKQPLPYAGLASQKQHLSIYLMGLYNGLGGSEETSHSEWFRSAWAKAGKKLDMGKCCVRFKRLDDVPLEVVGEAVRRVSAAAYVRSYDQTLDALGIAHKGKKALAKSAGGGAAAPKPAKKATKKATKKAAKKTAKKSAKKAARR